MVKQTTVTQRHEFYQRHQAGESYAVIAIQMGVCSGCVRYWCRRQRDGGDGQTRYQRTRRGLLSRFDPKVRYAIVRLKLAHPRWGPRSIRHRLEKRASLTGLPLPKEAQIGRYLHQWPCFRRRKPVILPSQRPDPPTYVHQRWQVDFKMGIGLTNGHQVNLHTVRDPVGEACLGAVIFPAGPIGQAPAKVTAAEVRTALRRCFARWHTLPAEVQTDGETTLSSHRQNDFPTDFTLWLTGLGIAHKVIRPARPTDNAEVERCHRTINDYAVIGNETQMREGLQTILDEAVEELAFELPSRAEGCAGRPPIQAHPELLRPPRPFQPELELAHFDLNRVDAYLATLTWQRQSSLTAQVSLGGQRYFVGRAYANRPISIRFDPTDRHLVFFEPDQPDKVICRWRVRGVEVEDLTGLALWPADLGPQQLLLPLFAPERVNF
jgi:transposase InsO family protein